MNRKFLLIVLTLAVVFFASGIAPAFATTYVNHISAMAWTALIAVPGQPPIGMICSHSDWGYTGRGDTITVCYQAMIPMVTYTDSPSAYNFEKNNVLPPTAAINLVKPGQIQVCRIGKIVIVLWTVPLVAAAGPIIPPATQPLWPAVTVPPGCLVLQGYDGAFPLTFPVDPKTGWTFTYDLKNYLAHETFICPGWHYFGPVGTGNPAFVPNISVEGTLTFYPP